MTCASSEMVINQQLEELIRMSSCVAKLKLGQPAYEKKIQVLYDEHPDQLEYCWNYVMYKWNVANKSWSGENPDTSQLFTVLTQLGEGLQNIIHHERKNWLAKIMKVKVDQFFQHSIYTSIEDLEEICSWQEEAPFEPYYIITYTLLSEAYFSIGEEEKAREYVELAVERAEKMTVLGELFEGIILEYYNKLKRGGSDYLKDKITELLERI